MRIFAIQKNIFKQIAALILLLNDFKTFFSNLNYFKNICDYLSIFRFIIHVITGVSYCWVQILFIYTSFLIKNFAAEQAGSCAGVTSARPDPSTQLTAPAAGQGEEGQAMKPTKQRRQLKQLRSKGKITQARQGWLRIEKNK